MRAVSDLYAGVTEKIYSVNKWLGVNEHPDGDTCLKAGEAAVMQNFKITSGGALKKRFGCENMAKLILGAALASTGETVTQMDSGDSSYRTLYDGAALSAGGLPQVSGSAKSYAAGNSEAIGRYTQLSAAKVGKLKSTSARARTKLYSGVVGTLPATGSGIAQTIVFDGLKFDFNTNQWNYDGYEIINLANLISNPSRAIGRYAVSLWPGRADDQAFVAQWMPGLMGLDHFRAYFNTAGYLIKITDFNYSSSGYVFYGDVILESLYRWEFETFAATSGEDRGTAVSCLWSGYVGGTEHMLAACNGYVWDLVGDSGGNFTVEAIGSCASSGAVTIFGYSGKVYVLDGQDYYSWDGKTYKSVEGYVPCIAVSSAPSGGGTAYEQVNKLTKCKSQRFSSDGTRDFYLAEQNIEAVYKVTVDGVESSFYTSNTATGCVTLGYVPTVGINNVQIWWRSTKCDRETVLGMHYSEMYSGRTDNRIFLYGDGSNRCIYSGITETGQASAEYFPDLNEARVGDDNTELTGLIRHYDKLLAFKRGSAWTIYYDTISLEDGSVTAGFYITPVNRTIGCDAAGQVCLVGNSPVTVDGRSVYEWRSSGNMTNDARNAQRISQRVESTLSGFDFARTVCYYDKLNHEYYAVCDGTAVIYGTDCDAWYIYKNFPASAIIAYGGEIYYGTPEGYLRRFSQDYTGDTGEAIDCLWQSGSIAMGNDFLIKYSPCLWVGIKPEENAKITAGLKTGSEYLTGEVSPPQSSGEPQMVRLRLKRSKFNYYTLVFSTYSAEDRATVYSCGVHVKYTGRVK